MKIILILLLLIVTNLKARESGQTEITTEGGIEVYQKEKYYLLKKNVEKDLYDIVDIYSQGNVVFKSNQGLRVLGNEVDHNVKQEIIDIRGEGSFLQNKDFTMISDGSIHINNISGEFKPNSFIKFHILFIF